MSTTKHKQLVLGIECGGTHTLAIWADRNGKEVRRARAGAANLRLLTDAQLLAHFRALNGTESVSGLCIGMAGARTETDRERIRRAAAQVWPGVPCHATNDLETGLMAASNAAGKRRALARVLMLSGTGSCCFGRNEGGTTVKVGGWGHFLGDEGSGYDIGLRAVKQAIMEFDRSGNWPTLGEHLLRALLLNQPDDLVGWAQQASKTEVAALAVEVFSAAARGDKLAGGVLEEAAEVLARSACACASRLVPLGGPVEFVLAGSVLLKQPGFAESVAKRVRKGWRQARVSLLERESAWGAVTLALQQAGSTPRVTPSGLSQQITSAPADDLRALVASPTEQRNPRSTRLDTMPLGEAIEVMLSEDEKIPEAIRARRGEIEAAIKLMRSALRRGGRLFYVGAGTSGRLGVLDASECPPTFQTPPEMVQGIMAGSYQALWSSIEGAEDDPEAGAQAVAGRGVCGRDVVVGIAASGRTPFVWGALAEARKRRAKTVLLAFNPHVAIPRDQRPDVAILIDAGPEVLTGSTRLKAGTGTKLVLNMFTTLTMVGLGKVISNLMVDVKASNAKLRDRATRILQALTGETYEQAQAALIREDWNVKSAFQRWQRRQRLRRR